jgi:cytochrome c oxidase subunit 1
VIGLSMLVFIVNVIYSYAVKREPAGPNPWNSKGAEWQYATPLPVHDFDKFPVFDPDPYPYGVEAPPVPATVPAS